MTTILSAQQEDLLTTLIPELFILGFDEATLSASNPAQAWLKQHLGGVILFDIDYQHYLSTGEKRSKNILSPDQIDSLTHAIHAIQPHAFIAVDCEGGARKDAPLQGVNRLKPRYGFPDTLTAAEIGALVTAGKIAEAKAACRDIANLVASHGFNLVFAPVLDMALNPDSPIMAKLGRCFSADPQIVITCANLFIEACHQHQLCCVGKHYPGHGSAEGDSHLACLDITDVWSPEELIPYQQVGASCDMIMTAHVVHKAIDPLWPASLSTRHLQRLRALIGESTLIICDDLSMAGAENIIREAYADSLSKLPLEEQQSFIEGKAIIHALQAGNDLLIFGNQLKPLSPDCLSRWTVVILDAIRSGQLSLETLQTSYQRILACKNRFLMPVTCS